MLIGVARVAQYTSWRPSGCVARAQAGRPVFIRLDIREKNYPRGSLGNNDHGTLVYRVQS